MSKPVSIEVSKRVYDYIMSEFLRIDKVGDAAGLLNNYKKGYFINSSFNDFLKGPQNKESLIDLLNYLKNVYVVAFHSEGFKYMSLFEDENDLENRVAKLERFRSLFTDIESIQEENEKLKSELESFRLSKEKEESSINEISSLKDCIKKLIEDNKSLKKDNESLKKDNESLKKDNESLKGINKALNDKLSVIRNLF